MKQGDKMACLLFCIVIFVIIKKTDKECKNAIKIGSRLLTKLAYSDDTALLGSKHAELQSYLDQHVHNSEELGLKIKHI